MKNIIIALIGTILLSSCNHTNSAPAPSPSVVTPAPVPAPAPTPTPPPSPSLLDQMIANGVPKAAATEAMAKYATFKSRATNSAWLTVIDFTKPSGQKRMYMVNTATGAVTAIYVAHGSGSDPNATGTPYKFSNIPNTHMSSLGAYLVSEKFMFANHGESMKLDGLENTDSLVRERGIYMHPATYVSAGRSKMGMSWGCFALSTTDIVTALSRLSGGSFLYAYSTVKSQSMDKLLSPDYHFVNEGEGAPLNGD